MDWRFYTLGMKLLKAMAPKTHRRIKEEQTMVVIATVERASVALSSQYATDNQPAVGTGIIPNKGAKTRAKAKEILRLRTH